MALQVLLQAGQKCYGVQLQRAQQVMYLLTAIA
jgi:hypothetical protein